MQQLELELAEGWSEVAPRSDVPSLLVEDSVARALCVL